MNYTIEELKQIALNASTKERELTFEKGLPWIYRESDGAMVYEYKNGAKILYDVIENKLIKRKIIPGI